MTWLDPLLRRTVRVEGVAAPKDRATLDLRAGVGVRLSLADDPEQLATRVQFDRDGSWLEPVRVRTTEVLPAATAAGELLVANALGALPEIDGATLTAGDAVLVMDQSAPVEHGIYLVEVAGDAETAWVLRRRSDALALRSGAILIVATGDDHGGKAFRLATPEPVVVGTTPLTFVEWEVAGVPGPEGPEGPPGPAPTPVANTIYASDGTTVELTEDPTCASIGLADDSNEHGIYAVGTDTSLLCEDRGPGVAVLGGSMGGAKDPPNHTASSVAAGGEHRHVVDGNTVYVLRPDGGLELNYLAGTRSTQVYGVRVAFDATSTASVEMLRFGLPGKAFGEITHHWDVTVAAFVTGTGGKWKLERTFTVRGVLDTPTWSDTDLDGLLVLAEHARPNFAAPDLYNDAGEVVLLSPAYSELPGAAETVHQAEIVLSITRLKAAPEMES